MEIAPTFRRVSHPLEIVLLWIVRGIVLGSKAGFVVGGSLGLPFFIVGALSGAPIGAAVGAVAGMFYGTVIGLALAVSVARRRTNPKGDNWQERSRKTAMRSANAFGAALLLNVVVWRNSHVFALALLTLMSFYPAVLWVLDNTGVPTWQSLSWGEGDSGQKHREKRAEAKRQMRERNPQHNAQRNSCPNRWPDSHHTKSVVPVGGEW